MKKTTHKQATGLLKKWQELLGLQHWVIRLHTVDAADLAPVEPDLIGSAKTNSKHLTCSMSIALQRPPNEVEATIIHELLHMMMTPLETVAMIAIGETGKQSQKILSEFLEQQCESLTIQLERAVMRIIEKDKA